MNSRIKSKDGPSIDASPGGDQRLVREEIEASYQTPIRVDTTFRWRDTVYRFQLTHYALMDHGITVPAKYIFDTGQPFTTHSFQSRIALLRGGDTVLSRYITKKDAAGFLTPELDSFATMFLSGLRREDDILFVDYSLSIPDTDIGIPLTFMLNLHGQGVITSEDFDERKKRN